MDKAEGARLNLDWNLGLDAGCCWREVAHPPADEASAELHRDAVVVREH